VRLPALSVAEGRSLIKMRRYRKQTTSPSPSGRNNNLITFITPNNGIIKLA
jgi:hypothetical protein